MKTEWKRSPASPAPQDTYPGGLIVTQLHFIHCCLFKIKTFDYKSDPSYSSNSRAALAHVKRSQQRTISEKIWFPMHPRNFGSDKIVRTYVRTYVYLEDVESSKAYTFCVTTWYWTSILWSSDRWQKGYPLTSVTWQYRSLRYRTHGVDVFDQLTSFWFLIDLGLRSIFLRWNSA